MKRDMLANDLKETVRSREEIRQAMHEAFKANDNEAFSAAYEEMMQRVALDITEEYDQRFEELQGQMDERALEARGYKPLTSEEKKFYKALEESVKAKNPRQAIENGNLIMPDTTINRVFEELQTDHPLLRRLSYIPTGAAVKIIVNTNGYQAAQWGELCDDIVKEALAGFARVDSSLYKLSAFMPICKAMLDLGPVWIDNFVRKTLYEMFANGAEEGFVDGDGNGKPIGMSRQVGAGVTVTDGVYPRKAEIVVKDLGPQTIGNLVSMIAVDPNGKPRRVRDLILLVNPLDYFQRVMPATTIMAPDGTYRNNVLPYPMDVIQSAAVPVGKAALGIGYRYLAMLGSERDGRIDYSDHYQFLQDNRVYLIKGYANGMPLDNNAFLWLDISGLQPLAYRVQQVDERTPSTDATLGALRVGALTLTPAFAPNTTAYTAATTNASNTIAAMPNDAGARVAITVGNKAVANGTAAEWAAGENTVTIVVTAEDGSTTKTYTVTVTKS